MTPDKKNPKVFLCTPMGPKFSKIRIYLSKTILQNNCDVTYIDLSRAGASIFNHLSYTIKESDIVLADITGNNPNVIFELGVSQALNKPILLIVQQGTMQEVPPDILHHYMYLQYNPKNLEGLSSEINSFLMHYKKQNKRKAKK
jgi:nucleoside 2-deoxyribosyltransferase